MDLVQNLPIKIKKLSMNLVHDRGSMDPVHESGPWTRTKEGVHGPLVHVLSSPLFTHDRFEKEGENILQPLSMLHHVIYSPTFPTTIGQIG